MRLINHTRSIDPISIQVYRSFFEKFRGLMFRTDLEKNSGIALQVYPLGVVNASIHMFFMQFDIAVIWIDQNMKVIDTNLAKKWRPYYAPKTAASYTIELHKDRLSDFQVNDQVEFTNE